MHNMNTHEYAMLLFHHYIIYTLYVYNLLLILLGAGATSDSINWTPQWQSQVGPTVCSSAGSSEGVRPSREIGRGTRNLLLHFGWQAPEHLGFLLPGKLDEDVTVEISKLAFSALTW